MKRARFLRIQYITQATSWFSSFIYFTRRLEQIIWLFIFDTYFDDQFTTNFEKKISVLNIFFSS